MSKRIPFNIKYRPQIESGEYTLETRDGNRARIICWDREDDANQPLVALVKKRCCEVVIYTKINGEYLGTYRHGYDLFIVAPEEELTDFENAFGRAMMEVPEPEGKEEWYQFLKEKAAELLSLAREQFIKDGYVIEKKAFHDAVKKVDPKVMKEVSEKWSAMKEALRIEYERGKADALKDIPRWKRFAPNINDTLSEQRICNELENSVLRVDVGGYCWIISREELNRLPKEDEK